MQVSPFFQHFFLQGQSPSTEIGRVYVFDKDDWDIADKTFNWKDGKAHPYFSLNSESGTFNGDSSFVILISHLYQE